MKNDSIPFDFGYLSNKELAKEDIHLEFHSKIQPNIKICNTQIKVQIDKRSVDFLQRYQATRKQK